jgi:Uma2 family endonuclease
MITTAKWTVDEYHRLIASGVLNDRRVELISGELVEVAMEGEPHAYSSDEAGEYLTTLLGERAKVRQAHPVTLSNDSEPEPDLAIVQRLGREYRQHHPYPSNIFWLIEYADSSLSKDLEVKAKLYASAGIQEYWVVNLQTMEVRVFRQPSTDGYGTEEVLTEGPIQPLAFPDLAIDLERLLNG